jgi:tRNA-specific 2-thiouridylase
MRVVVAMSGGVDSSVAAALLVEQGHEVIGLSMQLYVQCERDGRGSFGSCCSLDDLADARRVAAALDFPHYIVNFEEQFQATVVRNFVDEYTRGRTPIPCVHCNAELKFAHLVDRASGLDAAAVATGHYARVVFDEDGREYQLLRGADPDKDQSYFLFSLTQDQLARAMFPVGALTKADVRRHAARLGLAVADKPDSHEICFIPDGKTGDFVARHLPEETDGEIVDTGGAVLGRHRGIHRYTVGQRKGLGVSSGSPLYVIRLEPADHRVVVGPREELGQTDFTAARVNWIAGAAPASPIRATVRIRHRHTDALATITPEGPDTASVRFDTPQLAVTPGQAAVFYQGERVLGGGWIR